MGRAFYLGLTMYAVLCGPAQADHFAIDLQAEAAGQSRTAHAETLAPGVKAQARSVLRIKAGQRVKVKWILANRHAKDSFKDVLVHFFVVKEDQAGQQLVPKLGKSAIVESALTMDFRAGDKTQGELSFTIDTSGAYLLRLETIGAAVEPNGHEHYAALDVVVERVATRDHRPGKE